MPQRTCSIDKCASKILARGWCSKHYSRWKNHGDPKWESAPIPAFRPCAVEGCESSLKARGMCSSHLEKTRRYGSPLALPPKMQRTADEIAVGELECSKCSRLLPFTDFFVDNATKRGRKTCCKKCAVAAAKAWNEVNRERVRASTLVRRSSFTEEQRARHLLVTREWKRRNYDRVRDSIHRRRALKRETLVGQIDYVALWDDCGGICGLCGYVLDRSIAWPGPRFASIDHITPLSKGGTHTQDNMQYACLVCNLKKQDKI